MLNLLRTKLSKGLIPRPLGGGLKLPLKEPPLRAWEDYFLKERTQNLFWQEEPRVPGYFLLGLRGLTSLVGED